MAQLEPETPRTVRELREQQEAIAQAGLLALREPSRDVVLNEVLRIARDTLGGDFAKMVLLQPDGSLLLSAGVGWPEGVVGNLETPPGLMSQARATLETGEPIVVDHLPTEQRFEPNPALVAIGVVSGVSAVIEGTNRRYGVLQIDSTSPRAFSPDQIAFVQSAANVLGGFLDRETREQDRELFFNAVGHEVRGPLTTVLGFAQRLRRRLGVGAVVDERDAEALSAVEDGAQRMQRTINMLSDLLEVTARRPAVRQLVPVSQVLRSLVEEAQASHPEVRVEHENLTEGPPADERAARIALGNLLENAAKYSNLEPVVRVRMEISEQEAEVRVLDACGGLEMDELNRMFEAYYRGESPRSSTGLGLGLYLTERICSRYGWRISVENHPGEGCEFVVTIPYQQSDPS